MHVSSEPIKTQCLRISSNYFFFQIICMFLLSQSKSSVSEFHQIVFFSNHMHVSSKPIKSECLRISSIFFSNHMHVSSKPIESECLRISSSYFSNHMHVSSKPIKSGCLRISIFFSTFFKLLLDQSKPSVPQFLNSSLGLIPPKMTDSIQRQIRTSRRRRHSIVKT